MFELQLHFAIKNLHAGFTIDIKKNMDGQRC
jgi:hypothetical protein